MELYELQARYDARKSFYGKAMVLEEHDKKEITLLSYQTEVAKIKNGKLYITHDDNDLTYTTLRHIREFARQEGFKTGSKQELLKNTKNIAKNL